MTNPKKRMPLALMLIGQLKVDMPSQIIKVESMILST
jgi:hypothetical protein